MKKIYIAPAVQLVKLCTDNLCQDTLVIGSGNSSSTSGDGNDLAKDYDDYDDEGSVWNDD